MEIFNRTAITHVENGVGERRGAVGHLQAGRVLQRVVQHHRVGDSVVRMWGAGQVRVPALPRGPKGRQGNIDCHESGIQRNQQLINTHRQVVIITPLLVSVGKAAVGQLWNCLPQLPGIWLVVPQCKCV